MTSREFHERKTQQNLQSSSNKERPQNTTSRQETGPVIFFGSHSVFYGLIVSLCVTLVPG